MKIAKAMAVLLLVLLAGAVASAQAAADKIEWHTYDSGMARSKFEKKKVFLYFYIEDCIYCKEMERRTFKDSAVIAALNRNFIPIRVNADRDQQTSLLYSVKGFPDLWFIAESGEVIGHKPGFAPADQLMKILNVVMTGAAAK
jgi:thioredoxin-related protein